ncbi:MAG: nucleotide sugar dehydrogenase [Planctomycetota bacterium]|nr:nucleotide sugar dehydrogenase [Planctomycetota bacterium]
MSSSAEILRSKIESQSALVGVIGLGYVGLPLIDAFFKAGFKCLGFDVDPAKVEALNAGQSYIAHISNKMVQQWIKQEKLEATADMQRLAEPDAILICVPTPLSESRDPDLKYVVQTTEAIAKVARPGQLVVLESTTYPGTTRDVLVPVLESSGLVIGQDLFVAYSPEREDPGNEKFVAATIPKVVGGYDEPSRDLANSLYAKAVTRTVPVDSCEVAEACKILENTYRSVNIAMANELKVLFDKIGIDVWEVIDAAKTKPFGFQAFYPGPGLGGHCIPIDPFYLSWVARKHEIPTKFIELAGEINTSMPLYVVHKVSEALNAHGKPVQGSRIGIFGVAYKKDVDDPRESPSFKLLELLGARGAELSYCDPHIPRLPRMRSFDVPEMESSEMTAEYLAGLDCALIATDHTAFDYDFLVQHSQLVVDTRNATKQVAQGRDKIWKA